MISVSLLAAAQLLHEVGHAVAVRLFTGGDRFTLWALSARKASRKELAESRLY